LTRFVLFFDRREWSSGKLIVEAESEEEALELYQSGMRDRCRDRIAWDAPDDTEVALVSVEPVTPSH
jgi:hypothetical protein